MPTFPKPYIRSIRFNLFDFVAKVNGYSAQGVPISAVGPQKQSLQVGVDMFLSGRNVGSRTYTFGQKAGLPNVLDSGLPLVGSVITDDVSSMWINAFNDVLDVQIPEYNDEEEMGVLLGPRIFPRINRIEVDLPFDKPAERCVSAIVGMYESSDFHQDSQIVDADFRIQFVNDSLITSRFFQGREVTDQDLQSFRSANDLYSLKDFLGNQVVQQSVALFGASFFSVLKEYVFSYKDVSVEGIMADFADVFLAAAT